MLTKLYVVIFKPRIIGLFIKEKVYKIILMLLLAIVITITPEIIRISINDGFSNEFRNELKTAVISTDFKNISINDSTLTYEETYTLDLSAFTVTIGDYTSVSSAYELVFTEEKVTFYVSGIDLYNVTYAELELEELDFTIMSNDVQETSKFIKLFDQLYQNNKFEIILYNSLYMFFDLLFIVVVSAAIISFISNMFHKNGLPYKYKFVTTLNCQYIYLLFIFLSILYQALFLQVIGNILMVIYVISALGSISLKIERVK